MKKLLALSIVLSLVAGAVVAQVPDGITIGGWGRMNFVPIQGTFQSKDDSAGIAEQNFAWTGIGSSWGGPPRVDGRLIYSSERVGARLFLIADGALKASKDGDYVGDFADIWVKPFGTDILLIDMGKFNQDGLRGPGTDGDFHLFIGSPGKSGDAVFNRFQGNNGAYFQSKPIDALTIGLLVNAGPQTLSSIAAGTKAEIAWKKVQAGIGYNIDGIGLARVQYVGGTNDLTAAAAEKVVFDAGTFDGSDLDGSITLASQKDGKGWKYVKATTGTPSFSRIEAAFKFTMIDGLTADLGAKIPLPITENKTTYSDNVQINLAGSFATGDFGITYGLYSGFGGSVKPDSGKVLVENGATFNMILVPSYYLAAIDAKVGADIGLKIKGNSKLLETEQKDGSTIFGFGAWVQRNLGKGSIKVGAAYLLPENMNEGGTDGKTGYFSLPVILEFSF